MIFYRLQEKDYDITPDHISFNANFESLEKAMKADLLDSELLSNKELNELLKSQSIKEIWSDIKINQSKFLYGWVESGTSCFRNPEDLFNYFFDCFTEIDTSDTNYILVFEGNFIDYGSEGEDCVKFIREVERLSTKDFLDRFNLKEQLSKDNIAI
jgi:hypothetical protein